MKKWTYRQLCFYGYDIEKLTPREGGGNQFQSERLLNELGEDGWELVGCAVVPAEPGKLPVTHLFLKRSWQE